MGLHAPDMGTRLDLCKGAKLLVELKNFDLAQSDWDARRSH
jgi:hypothetical protein